MKFTITVICTFLMLLGNILVTAQSKESDLAIYDRSFEFGGARSIENQYFISNTEVKWFNLDGTLGGKDNFILYLKYLPSEKIGEDLYECSRFEVRTNDTIIKSVPSLAGWTYHLFREGTGKDKNYQVFGIDHKKFENLVDQNNVGFPPEKAYLVYNTFVDFHGFCDIFAASDEGMKGIQDIHKIGDKVVHFASHSKPPVNLGTSIKEGSYFENGEVTLELKGLSKVNQKETALIHFDSGESSFKMIMEPMPNITINTLGRSHYFGDIFIDLDTKWVQKVNMAEIVISKTLLPFPPNEVSSIAERQCKLVNVSKTDYEKQLK